MKDALVYATAAYAYLAEPFTAALGATAGRLHRERFPDAERYLRIDDPVDLRDVIVLGGTVDDAATLEIFDLGCTLVDEGARSLTLAIPYFGYSTSERAVKAGEVVGAKTRARLLSAIPRAQIGNAALLLDLHAEGIPYYFGDAITARHVYAKPLVTAAIRELGGAADVVVAATDAGRAKWVESLANEVGSPAAFVYKRRVSGSETRIIGVNADVAGKTVALYDDMIRTGGSTLQAAEAYRDAGAARVISLVTHFLPAPGAVQRLRSSGAIERVICTDSHPGSRGHDPAFVEVRSVAPLLARAATKEGSS